MVVGKYFFQLFILQFFIIVECFSYLSSLDKVNDIASGKNYLAQIGYLYFARFKI